VRISPLTTFFPAASRVVEQATGEAIEAPLFEVKAWELHGAAFTTAASATTLGLVHGAYYAVIHGEPTYEALRGGLDAAGAMAYPNPSPDALTLMRSEARGSSS
jgi:hypothetical protein